MNGQEIEIPTEITKMFSQVVLPMIPQQMMPPQPKVPQQVVRRVIECKDTSLRNVVIQMNKRLIELEKLINEKKPKIKSEVKQKVNKVVKVKPKVTKINKTNIIKKPKDSVKANKSKQSKIKKVYK